MQLDSHYYPYSSRRVPVFARRGLVATSQPLAAQAGLRILQKGGNAVDAAIATAAALTVVEPCSNGIGGDAFALVWAENKLHGLNASGPAPMGLSAEVLRRAGHRVMPRRGFVPVTVPGAPSAWATLSQRFGRLPLTQVLAPAIGYAEEGYAVSPTVARAWAKSCQEFAGHTGDEFRAWFETFAPQGRAPEAGEIWGSPDHARTLQQIAETGAEAFYRGELAERIDAFARRHGGYLRQEDLAGFQPEWVEPIGLDYRGFRVWELPPNGHGLVALLALNILKGFGFRSRDDVETYHIQLEAMKLAYADGLKYIADPRRAAVPVAALLSEGYADERRRLIGRRPLDPQPGAPAQGGTVYLAAADGEGNMVSMIQSNYRGFGSGLVVPGTGIALQNRGENFVLEEGHANCLAPGKRPYHTIIPGFLTRGNEPIGPFGVMGGFMQPQGHVQVVMNTVDFGLNPQAALDAPRWRWNFEEGAVEIEQGTGPHIFDALLRRGHPVAWPQTSVDFGRGQIIWRLENGVLAGASEPRADGQAAGW